MKKWPFEVIVESPLRSDIYTDWCDEHGLMLADDYEFLWRGSYSGKTRTETLVVFKEQENAVAFKLRFGS